MSSYVGRREDARIAAKLAEQITQLFIAVRQGQGQPLVQFAPPDQRLPVGMAEQDQH